MSKTVIASNVPVPYSGKIPGNMTAGKMIFVQGFTKPNAHRFSINLCTGLQQTPPDDIALAFSPSFGQGLVIVNHLKKMAWGKEVHIQNVFQPGQNFEVIFNAEASQFKVAVNGQHYVSYPHYVKKLQRISHITISGDVHIYNISMDGGCHAPPPACPLPTAPAYPPAQPGYPAPQPGYPAPQPGYPAPQPGYPAPQPGYPAPQPGYQAPQPGYPAPQPSYPPPQPGYPTAPAKPAGPTVISNPVLPYMDTIPGGMKEGMIIEVKVIVKSNPTRFHMNFQCGMSTNPRSDVAMQFNPRFNQKLINMNTLRNTKWDSFEEKHRGYFPFQPNGTYVIMFLCERQMFKVALNGSHLLEYKHRLPFQNITVLQIDGDCVVTQVVYH